MHFAGNELAVTMAQPLAAVVVLLVTALNYLSVRVGGAIQVLLGSLKTGTIAMIVVSGVLFGNQHVKEAATVVSPPSWGTMSAFLTALVAAMWA